MAKPELGTKRVCPTTGRKFYDLNNDPVVSPYSGESWPRASFEPLLKGPAARAANNDDDEDDDTGIDPAAASAEFVPLEDVEADAAKDVVTDDIEIDDEIAAGDDDDTFLEQEEEGDDDVAGLIDGEIEGDEET
ncbi:MAG: TIGR02300 family protein [Beijerinckiaceae bacterium]